MTDSHDGPPLTRRERKERERAAAEAAAAASGSSTDAASSEPAPAQQPGEQQAGDAASAQPATEAIDMTAILGASRGSGRAPTRQQPDEAQQQPGQAQPAAPAQPDAAADPADDVDDVFADAIDQEPHEEVDEAPARGFGRLFGRRKSGDDAAGEQQADEQSSEQVLGGGDPLDDLERAADQADEPAVDDRPSPPTPAAGVSVPSPSRAVGSTLPRIDVQQLDTVDDAEVDALEIDEVQVDDRRPVSSRWIAEATPAELEDRRPTTDDEQTDKVDSEAGPRRSGRTPVVVNVVEDTSEHHISDLRSADTASIASASSVGTGTSTITANALVLPASGAHEPVEMEGEDGVIVTGSIDLPDGFASSGRSRGTIDTSDVDATVDDPGELRTPETQPVRASKAVSSYANARVQIAPQRRSNNVVPIAIGVGGVVVAAGVAAVAAMGIAFGWF